MLFFKLYGLRTAVCRFHLPCSTLQVAFSTRARSAENFPVALFGLGKLGAVLAAVFRGAGAACLELGRPEDPRRTDLRFLTAGEDPDLSASDRFPGVHFPRGFAEDGDDGCSGIRGSRRYRTDRLREFEAAVYLVAVKPRDAAGVCREIAAAVPPRRKRAAVLVSAAAGVPIAALREAAPGFGGYARCMPQVTVATGGGVVPWFGDGAAGPALAEIFAPNEVLALRREEEVDFATVVGGAAPAFFAWLAARLEASEAGRGLAPADLRRVIALTLASTGEALLRDSPSEVMWRVASPGGATERALARFSDESVDAALADCLARVRELGRLPLD